MKALILTHSGFQDHELVYPYYRLLGAGFDAHIVAEKKDDQGRIYGQYGLNMPCHKLLSILSFDEAMKYDLLVIPGGVVACEKLRCMPDVIRFVQTWSEAGKTISSICHGPQLLISAKATKGRVIAAYYSMEDDITNSGATYSKAAVAVDEHIVTSPHYNFLAPWMEETLRVYHERN